MKQTKLKRIALPALAVLLAVFVLAGTAAGSDTLTQGFELPDSTNTEKNGIYYMSSLTGTGSDGTPFWIPTNSEAALNVNITNLNSKKITAYNISVLNHTTNIGADFNNLKYYISNLGLKDNENASESSGIGKYTDKGYNYAFTHSAGISNVYSDSTNPLFNVSLKGTKGDSTKYYQLDISGEASVVGSDTSKISGWKTKKIDEGSFKFYVLDKPEIKNLTFYKQHKQGLDSSPTFYLYAENTGAAYAVDAGIENYINGVHKIIWTGDNYISIVDSSESDSTKVKVTGQTGDATLKISIKDLAGSEKTVKVNVTKWNSSMVDNKLTANTITDSNGWNFKNNRVIIYTVKPGMPGFDKDNSPQDEFSTGWDTWVPAPALTGGNDTLSYNGNWLNEGDKTSNSNDVKGMVVSGNGNNNIITLNNGWGNFTVLKGSAANGFDSSKTVTITLTGYRLGDVNTNNDVDITDSALIGMIVAKIITDATDENKIYADCNVRGGDGTIDVADILALNKYIVGYTTIEGWTQQTTAP